jgi:hypothetical protein
MKALGRHRWPRDVSQEPTGLPENVPVTFAVTVKMSPSVFEPSGSVVKLYFALLAAFHAAMAKRPRCSWRSSSTTASSVKQRATTSGLVVSFANNERRARAMRGSSWDSSSSLIHGSTV